MMTARHRGYLARYAARVGEKRRKRRLVAARHRMADVLDHGRFRRVLEEYKASHMPAQAIARTGIVDRVRRFFKRKPSV